MPEETGEPARLDWRERLSVIVATMREVSCLTTPAEMVRQYSQRMRAVMPYDGMISLSRRGIEPPGYLIARSHLWQHEVDPWRRRAELPLLEGGVLGDLIYGEEPRVIDDFHADPGDPAFEHLQKVRSLVSVPVFDGGHALNTVLFLCWRPSGFDHEAVPEMVWQSNLFGRFTHNLALSDELRRVNGMLDAELESVGAIQRSLLPAELPRIAGLDLAAHYQTSRRAGGDYYDVFELPDGRFGLLIADVSGHGTPAAVLMAITHALAHSYAGPPASPGQRLEYVNRRLCERYTRDSGTFVTACYAVYDPATRELIHALAGHDRLRIQRRDCGELEVLGGPAGPPLGVLTEQRYPDSHATLQPGDRIVFLTDGITEARDAEGREFGNEGVARALCGQDRSARVGIDAILAALEAHTKGQAAADDRTLLVATVGG